MGSVAERNSHGPHCYWAVCQHPCCWEAERRLSKGISPQKGKLSSQECARTNDEFPTLTVVDVSQWTWGKDKSRSNPMYVSNSTDSLMCEASHQNQFFPSLSPLMEQNRRSEKRLQLPPVTCVDSSNQSKQQVKLNTAWIEPLASCPSPTRGSNMLVVWVPNSDQAPVALSQNSEERAKSPHVAVKEIFCLPSSETLIKSNIRKKTGVKKRVRFQLSFSPSISPLMASDLSEQCSVLGHTAGSWKATEDTGTFPLSDARAPNTTKWRPESAPSANKDPFLLRNKPVVFHDIREKKQRKVPGDVQIMYKLDYKNSEEGIDWKSLRAQAYLWKKYNLSNNRMKDKAVPPEGATAPLSPQHTHPRLNVIPQATVPHLRNPVLKGATGKTSPQQSSLLVSQSKSILKEPSKHSSSPGVQIPLHLFDGDAGKVPIMQGSDVHFTPGPLQPEEHPEDETEPTLNTSVATMSAEAEVPQHSQVMPPAFHSPASKKRLQWADFESLEPEPEVSCPELTAPPPSPKQKVPNEQRAVKMIK
ncbi:hypothetical protein AALO_G00064190 [Alosa alosa]|uniref:Uncharacterized protein n=1 Tax=Alosa alosa TaxID=278164 RepID=A0AAV6H0C1_9TELE|nr:uncharacterized protein C9orf43 homolog isoform X2 [Alosa alosa]KAG5280803.1 hypothetical protein AALO_G00064190 [Alosa alosa]